MQPYRIIAVGDRIANAVRTTLRAPGYGHPAHAELAKGYGPCRQCLRTFSVGQERRILFTYDPFHTRESLPLPGPVFIHESECERYPEDGGFPADMLSHRLTLNAYATGRRVVAQRYIEDGVVGPEIESLFRNPEVAYIHVRDTDAGCYDFTIERTRDSEPNDVEASTGGQANE
jgi:hypothetical protein